MIPYYQQAIFAIQFMVALAISEVTAHLFHQKKAYRVIRNKPLLSSKVILGQP